MKTFKLTENPDFVSFIEGNNSGTMHVSKNEYQKWLSQGNTPDPADVIDPMIAVRAKRDQLLIQADIEFNKLDDKGLSTTKIKADRVALRDLPTSQPTANIDTVDWTFLKVLKV